MAVAGGAIVRVEGLYSQKGTSLRYTEESFDDSVEVRFRLRLNYLELPVLLGWQSRSTQGPRFSVFAGPSVGVKMSSSLAFTSIELNGEDVTDDFESEVEELQDELERSLDLDDAVSKIDYGIVFGAGLDLGALTMDARYTIGLKDLTTRSESAVMKNRTFAVMLGYKFK